MLQPRVFPILAEVLRLANKQRVEQRCPRLRTRDGGLAAPEYRRDQQGRLDRAQRLSDDGEHRDGFGRQEITYSGSHVVARPEGDEGSALGHGSGSALGLGQAQGLRLIHPGSVAVNFFLSLRFLREFYALSCCVGSNCRVQSCAGQKLAC